MPQPPESSATIATPATLTPAMRQYFDAKRQYRGALLFFRMGDFYEMFYEDALVAARALELTLTSRSKDASGAAVPMCGVPHHAADTYITRLVRKGYRVAICEQVEDPRKAKGVVRREVVRVVSPGTLTDASYLDAREPAFLLSVVATSGAGTHNRQHLGAALIDVSTGEFSAAEYPGVGGAAGAPGRDRRPAATRDRRGRRPRPVDACCQRQAEGHSRDGDRRLALRSRNGPTDTAGPTSRQQSRRVRPGAAARRPSALQAPCCDTCETLRRRTSPTCGRSGTGKRLTVF